MVDIAVGTTNQGKIREIKKLVQIPGVRLAGLAELGFDRHIEETGSDFLENALVKARTLYEALGIPVMTDDSGLCVDYLNGRPGVYSARFAGPGASDRDNLELLLDRLKGVDPSRRTARFVCVAVFYPAHDSWFSEQGTVEGVISELPSGEGGFGYDPVFFLPSLGKTMAQLDPAHKNSISHRGEAFRRLGSRIETWHRDRGGVW
jgi:XTP/dITP diphosphohydrolase